MLAQLTEKIAAPKPAHLQWIQASIGQDLRMIPVEEILFFRSDEKYTCVQTEKYEALIRKPVRDLAEELDPALFWQIHRATLVNVNAIEGVTRDIRGRHLVMIKGRPTSWKSAAASCICSSRCEHLSYIKLPPTELV
jgi:DNA-binding LytR/AlgR family response regulator